jgi:hypothetical protein
LEICLSRAEAHRANWPNVPMLKLETLRIADAYTWLGSGSSAANYVSCNQSTVSRKLREVEEVLHWRNGDGAGSLLAMERRVHQHWRFSKQSDLRLHVYPWTHCAVKTSLTSGWRVNPSDVSVTKKSVLGLLQARVIDALCAPFPLVASIDRQDFGLFPLFTTSLHLLCDSGSSLAQERALTASDIGFASRFGALTFVPHEATDCSKRRDSQLFSGSCSDVSRPCATSRYWGTPLTPLVLKNLKILDYEPVGVYSEYLVVLNEWQSHPCILQLLRDLTKSIQSSSALETVRDLLAVGSND